MPGNLNRWILLAVLAAVVLGKVYSTSRKPSVAPRIETNSFSTALRAFEEKEAAMAGKYFAPELLAQKYGGVFEELWDSLNASTNKFTILKQFSAPKVIWSQRRAAREIAHSIQILDPSEEKLTLDTKTIRNLLEAQEAQGWRLIQCEFRHTAFSPERSESTFYFSAHLENSVDPERAIIEGDLRVKWASAEKPSILEIDATRLQVRLRKGATPFTLVLDKEVSPPPGSFFIDPLIVRDLDGDGRPEIILAAKNEVYRRTAAGEWTSSPLCDDDPRLIFTAVMADFNGDAVTDFLTARFEGLFLHEGTRGGKFSAPTRRVWEANPHLKYAQTLTCGDVDGDGDMDVFLGQYKVPYEKGNMPAPYFDANDGNPSFLLLNDGKGNFTDATSQSGLAEKSRRRVYSSSFIDLDGDKDLDLVVVSDFAGLNAFENDGHGHFTDATAKWFDETRAFGMAHCFSDFNGDGRLDILLIGMTSPTADRLEALNLSRPYEASDASMRKKVSHGNRLYFGADGGRFLETPVSEQIARTGWSWGCAAADFDGDGFPEIYIVNGHESRASVRDYETEFWLHDIYAGNSRDNILAQVYFQQKFKRTRGNDWSYGGYEKNRFFLNEGGTNFTEAAFLLGLGLEADCRNVVAADLNGDGTRDLIVTTFEVYPRVRQTLKIFENHLSQKSTAHPALEFNVTGDSYRSQAR